MASSTLSKVTFFLVLGLLIFLIVLAFANRRREFAITNVSWIVQNGTSTDTKDTMTTGGNNLYIANATSNLSLIIAPNPANTIGRQILIKNVTANTVTLASGSGVSISGTIAANDYGLFVVVGALNTFVRINE